MLHGTASHILDGDRADRIAVVTAAGTFVVAGADVAATRTPVFDPLLHVAEVAFSGVRVSVRIASTSIPRGPAGGADRPRADHGRRLPADSGHGPRPRQATGSSSACPIGSFQAVKHKAADMHVAIERARALAYYAALTIAER